ncbi:hypothetical protein SAMN04489832_0482 [Micromonospora cremea]|uniref:Uncharacterized protein n=1 Tax=Micromonospora cremea TaxID=709881 RepID=A0A1N5U0H1_9ACTN|nr:hypothetical protein SAMN04489832_0482 [Micromonospora cremea]
MPQIEWQKASPASASSSEAPQVTRKVVPQNNWQTTEGQDLLACLVRSGSACGSAVGPFRSVVDMVP